MCVVLLSWYLCKLKTHYMCLSESTCNFNRKHRWKNNIRQSVRELGGDKTVSKAFTVECDEVETRLGGKPSVGVSGQLERVRGVFRVASVGSASENVRTNREMICKAIVKAWRDIEAGKENTATLRGLQMAEEVMKARGHVMAQMRARWEWAMNLFGPFKQQMNRLIR